MGTDADREKERRGDNSEEMCGRADGRTQRQQKKKTKKKGKKIACTAAQTHLSGVRIRFKVRVSFGEVRRRQSERV